MPPQQTPQANVADAKIESRAQPWKAHWSPEPKKEGAGFKYCAKDDDEDGDGDVNTQGN